MSLIFERFSFIKFRENVKFLEKKRLRSARRFSGFDLEIFLSGQRGGFGGFVWTVSDIIIIFQKKIFFFKNFLHKKSGFQNDSLLQKFAFWNAFFILN